MNAVETQKLIKTTKDYFERALANELKLTRVSAPLFVTTKSGLNDNLNGVEKPVGFAIRNYNIDVEIVQSLAKWKRMALKKYGFEEGYGLYTDMNAIRADEFLDELHSIYVDQWDWEKIISTDERNDKYLHSTVKEIFKVFKETEDFLENLKPGMFLKKLPEEIFIISSEELLNFYPNKTPEEREELITRDKKAVFIQKIGGNLSDGKKHGQRSPDYDDWELNGDIIFWDSLINRAVELSSMGIRVNPESLLKQLKSAKAEDRLNQEYHKSLVKGILPQTIGGGIGQSRICMFFLDKRHIGEVQASVWDDETLNIARKEGLDIL